MEVDDHLAHESQCDRLDAEDDQQDPQEQQGSIGQGLPSEALDHHHDQDQPTDHRGEGADLTEEAQRLLREP